MIKYVVITFFIIIAIYIILNCLNINETFCDTDSDSDYNEYQNVLNPSQLKQINNMIQDQLLSVFSNGALIPGPKGNDGVQGSPGGTYTAMGHLTNKSTEITNDKLEIQNPKACNNQLELTSKSQNNDQIWYIMNDGKIANKFVNNANLNENYCLDYDSNHTLNLDNTCDKVTNTWRINNNTQQITTSNNKCIGLDSNNKMILEKCNENEIKQKWFIK